MSSSSSSLESTLRDIIGVVNPTRDDWAIRFSIIRDLQAVVESIESLRGATVEPFGSFVSNLFTKWGDLDISFELANGSYISVAGKKHKQTLLIDVLRALRRRGGWRNFHFIKNARVPILKLEASQHISCDISINNLNGQMKSKMLFWMNEIDGRFRDMVLLVKEWAKAHSLNDPKSGSLNSYSLSLLVVFHFQTCVPAIFPPLIDIYPGNMVDDLIGVRAAAEKQIEDTCAVNMNKYRSDRSRRINQSSLSELYISFLQKFSDISLRASDQGICPYTGSWDDINVNMRWLPKTYALFIEDPFEQPTNTARTVSIKQLGRLSDAVQTTLNQLLAPNHHPGLLLSSLAQPQVARFLLKSPAGAQTYSNRDHSQVPNQPAFGTLDHPLNRNSVTEHYGTNRRYSQPMQYRTGGREHVGTNQRSSRPVQNGTGGKEPAGKQRASRPVQKRIGDEEQNGTHGRSHRPAQNRTGVEEHNATVQVFPQPIKNRVDVNGINQRPSQPVKNGNDDKEQNGTHGRSPRPAQNRTGIEEHNATIQVFPQPVKNRVDVNGINQRPSQPVKNGNGDKEQNRTHSRSTQQSLNAAASEWRLKRSNAF